MTNPVRRSKGYRRQACDSCRKKKAKCEWNDGNTCILCARNNTDCNIRNVIRNRKAGLERLESIPISSRQADQMVNLLKKISNTLSAKVNDPKFSRESEDVEHDRARSLPSASDNSYSSPGDWNSIRDKMENLFQLLRHEESDFPDPDVETQTTNTGVVSATDHPDDQSNPILVRPETPGFTFPVALQSLDEYFLPSPNKLSPLPAQDEAIVLVDEYFDHFNQVFPLFDKASFMRLVLQHDLNHGNKREGTGWWASLNIVFALTHRYRAMWSNSSREEDLKSWGYLRNALEVLPELTLHNNDLLSVQALLGIVLFLQGTAMPYPAYSLTAAAIRQLHSLGLHKQNTAGYTEDAKQHRNVFWIAYFLDKDISLRTNQPFIQNEYDMDVEFPGADDDHFGEIWLNDGSDTINIFHLRLQLSIIQARIYQDLYSVPAGRQTRAEIIWHIQELHAQTERWRALIPAGFQPENIFASLDTPYLIHMTTLYIAYFNCVVKIHTKATEKEEIVMDESEIVVTPEAIRWSKDACLLAARATLQLLHYLPQGDYTCIWWNIFSFSEAFSILVKNISSNPSGRLSLSDLDLCGSMQGLVEALANSGQNPCVMPVYKRCTELLDKAKEELRLANFRK